MNPESLSTDEALARGARQERERVRQALHDGLGQLLTSISFLASSLQQKLEKKGLPEAAEAREVLVMTTQAIREAQGLIHNAPELFPIDESES